MIGLWFELDFQYLVALTWFESQLLFFECRYVIFKYIYYKIFWELFMDLNKVRTVDTDDDYTDDDYTDDDFDDDELMITLIDDD